MSSNTITLAIFSDIHGKILLPFVLVDHVQQVLGYQIDAILQCGDIGAFPDVGKLDKATLRHAEKNPDELGFSTFFINENPAVRDYLDLLNLTLTCVRGNHEDHEYLDKLEARYPNDPTFPIDVYQRVRVCKTGWHQQFQVNNVTVGLVGIGRIGHPDGHDDAVYIQEYERKALRKFLSARPSTDILLSHDRDKVPDSRYGSHEIREALDKIRFQYHFYGHTGQPYHVQLDKNGLTKSVKISELEFNHNGVLPAGCMVLLRISSNGNFELEVIDRRITNSITQYNWLQRVI